MTKTRKLLAVLSWVLGALGGGWTMLTLLAAYMTTTGYIQVEDLQSALPLPIAAIALALAVHLWPRKAASGRSWPWCLPVYLIAGGPVFLLLTTWLDQQYHK
jgi:chromate transport protein ChrA